MSKLFVEVQRGRQTVQPPPDDRVLLSIRTTAIMTSLSIRTVARYVKLGLLPSICIGKRRMIRKADVVALMENGLSKEAVRAARAKESK